MPTKAKTEDQSPDEPAKAKPAAKKAAPKKAAAKKAAPKKAAARKAPAKKAAPAIDAEAEAPAEKPAKKAPKKATARGRWADRPEPEGDGGEAAASAAKGKSLVIVESPAKAKTIEKYLGPDFKVMASIGHIIDLPVSSMGVDIENDFSPQYELIKGKKAIVDNLKKAARSAKRVYLAPDPDREGEAIAWHIATLIGNGQKEVHRAIFNEITRDAIREAIANPIEINQNLFNAQQARRILDRLVGYKISPLLWKKVRRGLSAGRVQSVALRLICDREKAIRIFKPVEYWTIEADARAQEPPPFRLRLDKIDGKKAEIPNKDSADAIIAETQGKPFIVNEVIKRETSRRPLPPFITSTLQQEASRKLRYTARRTMQLAQRLYEGVELGAEGPTGLITYMRTDSTRLSNLALDQIRGFVKETFGADYLPEQARFYTRGKGAQDAHEAIRPTDIRRTPESVAPYLEKEHLELYRLIWNRAVACQMADAKIENTRVEVPVGRNLFIATGGVVKFLGHLKIYEEARDEIGKTESDEENKDAAAEEKAAEGRLPALEKGDKLDVPKVEGLQHFTQPPPRFTEASLIKELERQGIGRPSTYATIISVIQDKEYSEKDKGQFKPTELGFIVTDLLTEAFPQVLDVNFTAMMEGQLDEVEDGKVNWVELLKSFYGPFSKRVEAATAAMPNLKAEMTPTDIICEKCGSSMVVRWGRNGKFLACSGYPNCRNTKPVAVSEDGTVTVVKEEKTDKVCQNCGKPMLIKSGRRGRFLACSGYPDCKTTSPLPIGVKCARPGCEGELLERRSAKGRTFYSCSAYPNCKFSVWELPVKTKCEVCNEEKWVVGKEPRRKVFGCSRDGCAFAPAYSESKEEEPAEAK